MNQAPTENVPEPSGRQLEPVSGFILVGGASSRMGSEKARLILKGQTFVERIAAEMLPVVHSVTVVGSPGKTIGLNLPSVADIYPDWGALGGLHGALAACQSPWALIVACDLPFVTSALFDRLIRLREDFDAIVPVQSDGRLQPLCALYARSACLDQAEHLIKSGERKPIGLLQSVRTRRVLFNELENLAGAEGFFENINTPQDYANANQKGINKRDAVARRLQGL